VEHDFDAAEYLNSTLPTLSFASQGSRNTSSSHVSNLTDLSSQTQTLLSQLNAQTSRLTTVLTQLTDDIIRSGGRLAYEVDVLRGEALGLSEVVNDGLRSEIDLFTQVPAVDGDEKGTDGTDITNDTPASEPQYISQLRMLTKVRERLDSVIKIFGEAMQWTLPPSEISITSSFISVSAPEPGSESQSREQKGKEFSERLRAEIADVIVDAADAEAGWDAAHGRIDALRDLAQVWKGTAEEKARVKFVESLVKLAEERLRDLEKGQSRITSPKRGSGNARRIDNREKGSGFLQHLQKSQLSNQ